MSNSQTLSFNTSLAGKISLALGVSLIGSLRRAAYTFWIVCAVVSALTYPQYFTQIRDFSLKNQAAAAAYWNKQITKKNRPHSGAGQEHRL